MPKRFVILCGDATYNRGDRGNLTSQLDLIRTQFPDAHITVDSFRPEVDKHWYEAEVLSRSLKSWRSHLKAILRADAVIWGGGALLVDHSSRIKIPYWTVRIALIKCLRKPVMVWAQGMIIKTRLSAVLTKWILISLHTTFFQCIKICTKRSTWASLILRAV